MMPDADVESAVCRIILVTLCFCDAVASHHLGTMIYITNTKTEAKIITLDLLELTVFAREHTPVLQVYLNQVFGTSLCYRHV